MPETTPSSDSLAFDKRGAVQTPPPVLDYDAEPLPAHVRSWLARSVQVRVGRQQLFWKVTVRASHALIVGALAATLAGFVWASSRQNGPGGLSVSEGAVMSLMVLSWVAGGWAFGALHSADSWFAYTVDSRAAEALWAVHAAFEEAILVRGTAEEIASLRADVTEAERLVAVLGEAGEAAVRHPGEFQEFKQLLALEDKVRANQPGLTLRAAKRLAAATQGNGLAALLDGVTPHR